MSLYNGAMTRLTMVCEWSEEFEVKVRMHQGYVLSPFLFTVVLVVIELA